MSYSVLLLGATGAVGSQIAATLSKYQDQFKRVAFLTATGDAGPEKETRYKTVPLSRAVGSLEDPKSYQGFDIVVCAVNDIAPGAAQIKYIDAAFEGGVKHFYPAEYGMDLSRPELQAESFFTKKLEVRKHLETIVSQDSSRGFTYITVGMWSDWTLKYNILGLSEDRKSANFIGAPDAKLTTTHVEDVGSIAALSLLPSHLKSLSERRHIRLSGSTLTISEYFSALSRVFGHEIKVQYNSKETAYALEQEHKARGDNFAVILLSLKRILGFGGSILDGTDNNSYSELKPKTWEEVVKATFA